MLKPLPNNSLVAERDRCRYADGDMSLTVWFDENGEIFAFELVFDLLLDEYAVRHTRGKLGKYLNVSEGELKPGRIQKQVLGSQNHSLAVITLGKVLKLGPTTFQGRFANI